MRSTYMDEYSGKRAVDGLVSKKGSGLGLRETPNRDRNAQLCSRLGCSGRLNSVKSAQIEKAKPSRPVFRSSSSGKEIIGSSSRSCVGVGNTRNSIAEPYKKLSSNLDTDSSETSSVQDDPEVSEIAPPPGKIQRGLHLESKNSVSSEITLMEVGSSGVASNTRSRRSFNQRSGLRSPDSIVGSSVSTGPKSTIQTRASTARNGLRSLRCNSVSDIAPSSCSSSDSSLGQRETIKKRTSEGESSSAAKGKKMNGSSSAQNSNSSHGISISDSRRARNMPSNRDNNGVASVRTRRTVAGHSRGRLLPHQGSGNNSSSNGFSAVGPHTSQPEMSINSNASTSSQQLSAEVPLIRQNSYSRPGSSSGTLHGILRAGASDVGFSRSLMNQDGLRRYNMDGIAEVLLALERLEHDEELSFEQILVLETNLFLNSLNIYDHHRDMRLDIDNMTYEELLALEERMGTVSTALPEEALSDCLKKSIYQSTPQEDASVSCDGKEDVKCSICQEEYVAEAEVGRLRCEHSFHIVCVNQWLRLKNWCPICKAAAAPATAPLPSPPST